MSGQLRISSEACASLQPPACFAWSGSECRVLRGSAWKSPEIDRAAPIRWDLQPETIHREPDGLIGDIDPANAQTRGGAEHLEKAVRLSRAQRLLKTGFAAPQPSTQTASLAPTRVDSTRAGASVATPDHCPIPRSYLAASWSPFARFSAVSRPMILENRPSSC